LKYNSVLGVLTTRVTMCFVQQHVCESSSKYESSMEDATLSPRQRVSFKAGSRSPVYLVCSRLCLHSLYVLPISVLAKCQMLSVNWLFAP